MATKGKIYNQELIYHGTPVPFVIITLHDLDKISGGIADDPHRHNYYSVIWSLGATGRHVIDFREYAILPDQIFFVSPEQVHQVITDANPEGYLILFTHGFLEKNSINDDFISNLKIFQKSDETPPLALNEKMNALLKTFAGEMLKAFQSEDEMRYEIIGAYLKLFLITCNEHCSLHADSNPQIIEVGKSLVKNFKASVEKHYAEWHRVKDYADMLNVSPNYLNEVIKTSVNISAKDFIQNRLVLEAKRMVLFTGKSSKEIGFDLGFEDPSHFSKFFKSNTGLSLQEFKESHTI